MSNQKRSCLWEGAPLTRQWEISALTIGTRATCSKTPLLKKKNPRNYRRTVPAFLPCQTYFEDNPRDLQLLRHDLPLHPAVVKPHLGNVPDYLGEQGGLCIHPWAAVPWGDTEPWELGSEHVHKHNSAQCPWVGVALSVGETGNQGSILLSMPGVSYLEPGPMKERANTWPSSLLCVEGSDWV